MHQETRMDVAARRVAKAQAAIEQQKKHIAKLERDGYPTNGSYILLDLMEEALLDAQELHAKLRSKAVHSLLALVQR